MKVILLAVALCFCIGQEISCSEEQYTEVETGQCLQIPICEDGLYFNLDDKVCETKEKTCNPPNILQNNECLECPDETYYDYKLSKCELIPICPDDSHFNTNTTNCESFIVTCSQDEQFNSELGVCQQIECQSPKVLQNNICVEACPSDQKFNFDLLKCNKLCADDETIDTESQQCKKNNQTQYSLTAMMAAILFGMLLHLIPKRFFYPQQSGNQTKEIQISAKQHDDEETIQLNQLNIDELNFSKLMEQNKRRQRSKSSRRSVLDDKESQSDFSDYSSQRGTTLYQFQTRRRSTKVTKPNSAQPPIQRTNRIVQKVDHLQIDMRPKTATLLVSQETASKSGQDIIGEELFSEHSSQQIDGMIDQMQRNNSFTRKSNKEKRKSETSTKDIESLKN